MNQSTVFDQLGAETFRQLVDEFYARIEQDPVLRPIFPPNLEKGKEAQYLFLMQYFGGPDIYNQQRGHPRLRMRHAPFSIGQAESELWLKHMLAAMEAVNIPEPARTVMQDYFKRSAPFMINRFDQGNPDLKVISKLQ